jgi:hypothetical protein
MPLQPSWPEWESQEICEIAEPCVITRFPGLEHLAGLLRQQSVWEFWNPSHVARDAEQEGVWETKIENEGFDEDGDYSAQ